MHDTQHFAEKTSGPVVCECAWLGFTAWCTEPSAGSLEWKTQSGGLGRQQSQGKRGRPKAEKTLFPDNSVTAILHRCCISLCRCCPCPMQVSPLAGRLWCLCVLIFTQLVLGYSRIWTRFKPDGTKVFNQVPLTDMCKTPCYWEEEGYFIALVQVSCFVPAQQTNVLPRFLDSPVPVRFK